MKIRLFIILVLLTLIASACSSGPNDAIADLPRPGDVQNYLKLSDVLLTYDTDISLDKVLAYYRDLLSKKGYVERTQIAYTTKTDFGIVFDGHASGKLLIVQGAVLGQRSTVTIRLRDKNESTK